MKKNLMQIFKVAMVMIGLTAVLLLILALMLANMISMVTVNADFSDAKGSFVGYFHGHTHIDSLHTSFGINVIGTRCDGLEEYTPELRAERVAGTVTEKSFDVFTVNARTRTIHVTKIGAGSDRTITY